MRSLAKKKTSNKVSYFRTSQLIIEEIKHKKWNYSASSILNKAMIILLRQKNVIYNLNKLDNWIYEQLDNFKNFVKL